MIMIAGPNGAGKSTFIERHRNGFLKDIPVIDSDALAREIDPDNVGAVAVQARAARAALAEISKHINNKQSFARETTFAGHKGLRDIVKAQKKGFRVEMHFLGLANWEASRYRVNERVKKGGHDIPTKIIQRRYDRILDNLQQAFETTNSTYLYDSQDERHIEIATITPQEVILKQDLPPWARGVNELARLKVVDRSYQEDHDLGR